MKRPPFLALDTSVAVKWFFHEKHSAKAIALLRQFREGLFEPIAPDLIYAEFVNTVWKRVRSGEIQAADGEIIVAQFIKLPLGIRRSSVLLPSALELAVQHRQTVYDCLFLAVSLENDVDLITADERFYNGLHGAIPQLKRLADWVS